MSTLKKFGILTALTLLSFPFLRVSSRVDVNVNWSIQEATPTDHLVTIRDFSFTIPAGQSVNKTIPLKGGATAAVLWSIRGWGFLGQQIKVDGKEIPLDRIRTANRRGEYRILIFGRSAAMDASIKM